MPPSLLEQLARREVPPLSQDFERDLHVRLNNSLLVVHLLDLALRGTLYAFWHFARGVMGCVRLTLSGRYDARSDQSTGGVN